MDVQDILKSLSNLEQNLQNVESARKQVQETVNAYDVTREQLSKLATEVKVITTELSSIFSLIKENQTELANEILSNVHCVFSRITEKVDELEGSAQSIKDEFAKTCEFSAKSIDEAINTSLKTMNESVDQTVKGFNDKAFSEIAGVVEVLANYKAFALSMPEEYKAAISKAVSAQKSALANVSIDFQSAIEKHLTAFDNIQNEFVSLLEQYKRQQIELKTAFISKIDALVIIQKQLDGKLGAIDFKIDSSTKELMEGFSSLYDSNLGTAKQIYDHFNKLEKSVSEIKETCIQTKSQIVSTDSELKVKIDKVNRNSNKMLIFVICGLLVSLFLNLLIFMKL